MKIKVANLEGICLDYAVAVANGDLYTACGNVRIVDKNLVTIESGDWEEPDIWRKYSPSDDWGLAGPIIDENDISFRKYHRPDSPQHGTYYAMVCRESGCIVHWHKAWSFQGATALIAAMRCYVASKLGAEVDIPDQLLEVK